MVTRHADTERLHRFARAKTIQGHLTMPATIYIASILIAGIVVINTVSYLRVF